MKIIYIIGIVCLMMGGLVSASCLLPQDITPSPEPPRIKLAPVFPGEPPTLNPEEPKAIQPKPIRSSSSGGKTISLDSGKYRVYTSQNLINVRAGGKNKCFIRVPPKGIYTDWCGEFLINIKISDWGKRQKIIEVEVLN